MGDFAGGLLKYLREHPIPRLTIAGGFAKLTKLAQGALDLHSSRSEVDRAFLATLARRRRHGVAADAIARANTRRGGAAASPEKNGMPLAQLVARKARAARRPTRARGAPVAVNVLIVDRDGRILAET